MMCVISTVKLAVVWQPVVNVSVQNARQLVMICPVSRRGGVTVSCESQISEFQTARDDVSDQQGEASSGVTVSRESQNSELETARDDGTDDHGEASSGVLDILTAIA